MKGLIHKIDVPVYCQRVYLSFCKETLERKFNLTGQANPTCDGFAAKIYEEDGKAAFVLYLEKRFNSICVTTTAHECYHIADMIFENCGVEYNYESGNEHMAYFLDYLVGRAFDCLADESEFLEHLEKQGQAL